jgi:hypothetical protein
MSLLPGSAHRPPVFEIGRGRNKYQRESQIFGDKLVTTAMAFGFGRAGKTIHVALGLLWGRPLVVQPFVLAARKRKRPPPTVEFTCDRPKFQFGQTIIPLFRFG